MRGRGEIMVKVRDGSSRVEFLTFFIRLWAILGLAIRRNLTDSWSWGLNVEESSIYELEEDFGEE